MVNEKHLAIVRSALQYFDEELTPHGSSFEQYLDEEATSLNIKNADIKLTRQAFSNLRPRQVMLDIESSKIVMKQHFASEDAAEGTTPAKQIKFATLLLPSIWIR